MTPRLLDRFGNSISSRDESVNGSEIQIPGFPFIGGLDLTQRAKLINNWRRNYNPLRGITLQTAIQRIEDYNRGRYAELMWLYRFIERLDPDLIALINRRVNAISKLPWSIKQNERLAEKNQSLADEQQQYLQEMYDGIDNLKKNIESLALASFRGYAMSQKQVDINGDVIHLEILDPWHVVRDGVYGKYRYNPTTNYCEFTSLTPDADIDPNAWIIREVERPINFFALLKFIYSGECDKNWAAFVEMYGIPGAVITLPDGITPANISLWQQEVQKIVNGGTGALPFGAEVKEYTPWDGSQSPFECRQRYLTEKLILVGTHGMLTMLNGPTGIGKGSSEEHADVFDDIATHEALDISDVFNTQLTNPLLDIAFPGEKKLAYFEISPNEEEDPVQLATLVKLYSDAGYEVDEKWLKETTGMPLTKKEAIDPYAMSNDPDVQGDMPNESSAKKDSTRKANQMPSRLQNASRNGNQKVQEIQDSIAKALDSDLKPIRDRLDNILKIEDVELMKLKLAEFRDSIPKMTKDILWNPATAIEFEKMLKDAFVDQLSQPIGE